MRRGRAGHRRRRGRRRRRARSRWPRRVSAFHFPDDVWARVIYDLVITARDPQAVAGGLVAALVPIYFGRVGSFVIENRNVTTEQAEERVERQAREFELPQAVPRRSLERRGGRRRADEPAKSPLPASILIPVANPGTAEELIRLGAAMLDPRAGQLSALGIVEVPEGMPLSEGATRARHARRLLQKVLDYAPEGTTIHPIVRIGRHAAEGIVEAAAEQEADLIIFGWGGKAPAGHDGRNGGPTVFSPTIDEVVRDSPCDIAVVKQRGARDIKRVLVPVRGGPHAELAVRFADAIASLSRRDGRRPPPRPAGDHDGRPGPGGTGPGHVHQAAPAGQGRGASCARRPTSATRSCARPSGPTSWSWARARRPAATGRTRTCSGRSPRRSPPRAKSSVVVVKTREAIGRTTFEPLADQGRDAGRRGSGRRGGPRGPGPGRALVRRIELPPRRVRRPAPARPAQGEAGRHGQPRPADARRGGDRSGRSSAARCARWSGRVPLLDEILVIDSASTDRTREIAEAEGARVVQHPDVLARYGSFRGKGEALWKSLYETSGDIIVWADTDVKHWHPRMVYGTLGPLLHEPRLQYVKGYYQRPIVEDGVMKEGGGGRVTELVARPLINLFYPELSGMIQPLAGEYAGRRALLETIPFFTGYAVEIGHLIDAAERVGIEGLGQVDLERRVHRNQELEGLSRMSFVILQAVMKRLEERRKARLFAELGSTMKLPRSGKGRLSLEVIELADQERPPMIRIPEYLERRRGHGRARRRRSSSSALDAAALQAAMDGAGRAPRRRRRQRRRRELPGRGHGRARPRLVGGADRRRRRRAWSCRSSPATATGSSAPRSC